MELSILYQKTGSGSINYWRVFTNCDTVHSEWGQVGTTSPQRESYVARPTNVGRKNERDGVAQAEFEAKALWKKKKRVKYFESIEDAQTKLNLKPMLAKEYKERLAMGKVVFPVMVQPKLNGYRAFVYKRNGQVLVQSRGGKFYGMQHIIDEISHTLMMMDDLQLILDGELYHHGMSLQKTSSLVKRPRYPGSEQIQMHVYDTTSATEPGDGLEWGERFCNLENIDQALLSRLQYFVKVDSVLANSPHEVDMLHKAFVADGYEGAIIRTMDHRYRFGYRSPGLLKRKDMEDKEFIIVGWTVGKDDVPMWVVKLENGRELPVRPLGTEEERAEMLQDADNQIGKLLKVRFQDRTDDGVPTMARGIEIRDEADL